MFDRNYAPRALALYRSLERWDEEARVFVVCMDRESEELFSGLEAEVIGIGEVERFDPGLAAVRPARTPVEYAWTAVPAVCRFLLEREPELTTLTYLDADLLLHSSPQPLFDELGDGSILLIPHRMDPREEVWLGRFNVGWVTFRRDANATAALDWWRERCLEWCHNRVEPGRFGDQKYIEEWPRLFEGVRVTTNPGAGLGPWNQTRETVEPVIFFHYSGLSLHPARGRLARVATRSGVYRRTGPFVWTIRARHKGRALDDVWAPYVERLAASPWQPDLEPLSPRALAAAIARERAPAQLRDLHLAIRRRVMASRAAPRRRP